MWSIKIENHAKREKKVGNAYAMIFKEFCLSHMPNIIKNHPKYDSILNNTLKLMDAIDQSMLNPTRETYPYLH